MSRLGQEPYHATPRLDTQRDHVQRRLEHDDAIIFSDFLSRKPMQRHALSPNVITFSAQFSFCEKGSPTYKALDLLPCKRRQALSLDLIV